MFGELRIVPTGDLGDIGQQQSQAATVDLKWYCSAAGLLIWLALIAAILVPKANHNLHVLWILVPLAIVNLAWLVFKSILGTPSVFTSQLDALFQAMVVGTAALWLMVHYLRRFGGFVRFVMCLGILLVAGALSVLSYSIEFSRETPLFFPFVPLLALAMLGAITLSRRLCGGRYRPVCFVLWLLLWTLLGSLIALGGSVLVASLFLPGAPSLPLIVVVGAVLGLCLYALTLPFMVLGFLHPFFRDRFCACLGLEPVSSEVAVTNAESRSEP